MNSHTIDPDAELREHIATIQQVLDSDDECAAEIQWHLEQARHANAERARREQR